MTFILLFLIIVLVGLLCLAAFYLYRFSVIILEQEKIYEGVIKTLDELEDKFAEFEKMPFYFDNPESRSLFLEFKQRIFLSRFQLLDLVQKLLLFSNKKYIIIEEVTPQEQLNNENNN
jgi:hypothetical protein